MNVHPVSAFVEEPVVPVVSPFIDALPSSLRAQLEALLASPTLDVQRKKLSLTSHATPTEEDSCSCATCGSTCCDMV